MTTTAERIDEFVSSGNLKDAERVLEAAGPEDMQAYDRHYYKGLLLERHSRWGAAAEQYEAVVAENVDHTEATFRLALLADRFGDEERAIELYEACTEDTPAHVNALLNLAILYEDAECYDDAMACLDRVLGEYPNHTRARLFHKDVASSLDMYYDEEGERYREKRDALLETPISDFELSVRSRNCLRQMNINSLGDLLKTTAVELLAYKNFGETSLHEIEAMLSQKGLRIGQLLEDKDGGLLGTATVSDSADKVKAGLLNRSVAELELSVRSRKCLMRLGISAIGELTQRSEAELLAIKNFGMTSLSEIKRRLTEIGLALRND